MIEFKKKQDIKKEDEDKRATEYRNNGWNYFPKEINFCKKDLADILRKNLSYKTTKILLSEDLQDCIIHNQFLSKVNPFPDVKGMKNLHAVYNKIFYSKIR